MSGIVIMKLNSENGIKLEINTENTDTLTNVSVVKSENGKDAIKLDPFESDDDHDVFENFVKDDIDDDMKFEQYEDNDDNSFDYTPPTVKKSVKKPKTRKEKGSDENRVKKRTKPRIIREPGSCEECKKPHIETKEGEPKEYPCDLCEKSYVCVKSLRTHKKFHAGVYKCHICGKSVTSKGVLEAHINNRHKGPYPCEICGKLYNTIHALSKHKVFHGKVVTNVRKMIMKCTICGKSFKGKWSLQNHMIGHSTDKPHTCDICGASFSRSSSLYVHKRSHSEENYIFPCDICGKTLKNSTTLATHKLNHNDTTFPCDMCDKVFSSKSGMRKHHKSHTGIGMHNCSLCDKSYNCKYKLTRHEKTHSGIKAFYCEACNMSFYSNGELQKHKKLSIRHADNMKKMGGRDDEVLDQLKDENAE